MRVLASIVSFLFILLNFKSLAEIIEVDDSNFEDIVFGQPGKYSFVYFYSPHCQHCENLNPHFDPLDELYGDTNLQIFKINGLHNKRVRKLYNLVGFPVLKVFSSDGESIGFYNKAVRTTSRMIDFLIETTGVKPNYPPKAVVEITSKNIDEIIYKQLNQDVILVFYAPWIDKWDNSYSSFYQELAKYYQDVVKDGTIFASVDVSKSENVDLIADYQVTKYPTLFHFPKYRENNEEEVYVLDENVGPEEIVGCLMESQVGQRMINLREMREATEKLLKQRDNLDQDEDNEDDDMRKYREL